MAKARCPNCTEFVTGHPENGCVLAALMTCIRDRGGKTPDELAEIHANANVDRFWQYVGPILDMLEDGDLNEK